MANDSIKSSSDLRKEIGVGSLSDSKGKKLQLELLASVERAEKLSQSNSNLMRQLTDKQKEFAALQLRYEELNRVINEKQTEASGIEQRYMEALNQVARVKKELELARRRLSNSFTSQELADYLNNAIQEFNYQMEQTSETVSYKINSLDIDMKAQIVKQNDELGFITGTDSGESALSNIKISIVAIPK